MKIANRLIMALLLSTVFLACKKDNVDPVFTVEGMWEGKLGNGNSTPNGAYRLNIKKGGQIQRINSSGDASATGTWALNGSNFTAKYTFADDGTEVEVVGQLDKNSQKISGTWSNDGGGGGQFFVTKQQK